MTSRNHMLWIGPSQIAALSVFAALSLGSLVARAQTVTVTPAGSPAVASNPNCAVSTARIGNLDVTEFFGIGGGPASFAQHFGGSPASSSDTLSLAQRCIRLEVENPAPGDLVPAGGYVISGFAFDPLTAPGQGPGITSVQIFLDDPNQGASLIGEASASTGSVGTGFGLASARGAAFGDQFSNSGFRLTIQLPSSAANSTHALYAVALSTTGRAGSVAVPINVGNLTPAAPTRTP
jgi:hypothetical protein